MTNPGIAPCPQPNWLEHYPLIDREMTKFPNGANPGGSLMLNGEQYPSAMHNAKEQTRHAVRLDSTAVLTEEEILALQSPALQVGPEVVQCIEELSQANERLCQIQEQLLARAAALELQAALNTARLKTMENICQILAHDLGEPVQRMRNFTQSLLVENGGAPTESYKVCAEQIASAGARLEQLINNLLKYGQMNHEELTLRTVSLENSVRRVVGEMIQTIADKRAEVHTVGPLPEVEANAALLRQVLFNLLDNSLKFVPPESSPCVRIWAEPRPAAVRLYVEDNGIGVAPEHHERIFSLFERVSDTYPGTGLGLALVRKSVEQMGGQAGVESQSGKGSRFWIQLPKPH